MTDPVAQDTLLDGLYKSLTRDQTSLCDGLLTFAETETAVKAFKSGKSGLDGLTAEFYQYFWPVLGPDFVAVSNFAFQHNEMSISQHRGLLTLVFKVKNKLLDLFDYYVDQFALSYVWRV